MKTRTMYSKGCSKIHFDIPLTSYIIFFFKVLFISFVLLSKWHFYQPTCMSRKLEVIFASFSPSLPIYWWLLNLSLSIFAFSTLDQLKITFLLEVLSQLPALSFIIIPHFPNSSLTLIPLFSYNPFFYTAFRMTFYISNCISYHNLKLSMTTYCI